MTLPLNCDPVTSHFANPNLNTVPRCQHQGHRKLSTWYFFFPPKASNYLHSLDSQMTPLALIKAESPKGWDLSMGPIGAFFFSRVSSNYQLDIIKTKKRAWWGLPGLYLPVGMPEGGFLNWVNWGWKTHFQCAQHHFMGWALASILSALLAVGVTSWFVSCLDSPKVMGCNLELWAKINFYSFVLQ